MDGVKYEFYTPYYGKTLHKMSNWNRLQYFGTSLLDTLQESDYTTLFPNYILNEKIDRKDY